jgi:hypothetical protein
MRLQRARSTASRKADQAAGAAGAAFDVTSDYIEDADFERR